MSTEVLNINDIEFTNVSELIEELDSLELELIEAAELENEYGFVYSKGGGSRPKPTMGY